MKKGMKTYMKMTAIAGLFILAMFVVHPAIAADDEKAVPQPTPSAQMDTEEFEGPKPSAEMNVGFLSQYIWRGQAFTRDSLVIQPELTLGWYGFTLDIWANLDTNQYVVGRRRRIQRPFRPRQGERNRHHVCLRKRIRPGVRGTRLHLLRFGRGGRFSGVLPEFGSGRPSVPHTDRVQGIHSISQLVFALRHRTLVPVV